MYPRLIKFLRQLLSCLDCAVIGIVNDDLPAFLKEIPNESLASKFYVAPKRFSFRTFFAYATYQCQMRGSRTEQTDRE